MTTLPGRINVTVCTPSGQSCTIAALASGCVDQLHGAIERMLKIPMPVQRLIMTCDSGAKEIHSNELLSTLGLQHGNQITVLNSWPTQPAEIVEKLKLAASYPSRNTAAAIARCLTNEDSSVKESSLRALSWMTRHASAHASDVAKLLREDAEEAVAMGVRVMDPRRLPRIQVRNAAAHTLSWLEEAGATYAADVLLFGWNGWKFSASDAFEEMCQSEAAKTRTAAIHSIVKMLENDCGPLPVPAFHKLCCCQISRRYLVRALFDEDVHNAMQWLHEKFQQFQLIEGEGIEVTPGPRYPMGAYLDDLRVLEVIEDSVAAKAGVLPGDIIQQVDDVEITTQEESAL
eukprot:g1585.t1